MRIVRHAVVVFAVLFAAATASAQLSNDDISGVLSCRQGSQWSPPILKELTKDSVGLQGTVASITLNGLLAAGAVVIASAGAAADWKGELAQKAIGRAAREGLEHAMKDAALDRALEVVVDDDVVADAADYARSRLRDVEERDAIAETVGYGIETAIRAADVASTLDDVVDTARTVKRIHKTLRAIR